MTKSKEKIYNPELYVSGCATCPCQHELGGPCRATDHGYGHNAASALPYDDFPDDCPLDECDEP